MGLPKEGCISRAGKSFGMHRAKKWVGPEAFRSCVAFSMMELMSSEDENDLISSGEQREHNVEYIMLCSFAHLACRPFLARVLI